MGRDDRTRRDVTVRGFGKFADRAAQAGAFVVDENECTRRFVRTGKMLDLTDARRRCTGNGRGLRCAHRRKGIWRYAGLRAGARCERQPEANARNLVR